MRKKYLNIMILSFTITFAVSSVVSVTKANFIGRAYVRQEKTNWCWAASAENSVWAFMQPAHTQREAVRKVKGTSAIPYPNKPGSLSEIAEAADYICNNRESYYGVATTLSFQSLKRYNENGYAPILISGKYTDIRAYGHAVALVDCFVENGIEYVWYYECDQFSKNVKPGYHKCTFKKFCDGTYNEKIYDGTVYNYLSVC